jgi:transposase
MSLEEAQKAELRRLYFAEHWKVGTIATQLGLHHEVVERVLGLHKRARRKPLAPSAVGAAAAPQVPVPLQGYESLVSEILAQYPRLCATRLYDMLVERGFQGSMRTVRRFVRGVRPRPKTEVFLRTEPLIAEQAQIDWAYVGKLPVAGGTRPLWAFVMVLSYSRALWGELVLDLSAVSLRRSLVRASSYFQGVTRQWLFDNPKVVVLERHGDAVRFHPELLSLCGQMCVAPRLCAVRKPQQKGRVERAIRFLRDRFFAARTIRDIDRGNAELLSFLDEIAKAACPRGARRRAESVAPVARATALHGPRAAGRGGQDRFGALRYQSLLGPARLRQQDPDARGQ